MSENQINELAANETAGLASALPTVTVVYDVKTIAALSRLKKRLFVIFVGLVFAIYGTYGLFFLILKIENDILSSSLLQYIWALLFGFCCLLFNPILYALSPVLAKKKVKQWQRTDTLVFGQMVICRVRSLHLTEERVHEWSVFIKTVETKEYFFLRTDYGVERLGAYAVRKSDLKNCTVEEFRDLLKWKLGAVVK